MQKQQLISKLARGRPNHPGPYKKIQVRGNKVEKNLQSLFKVKKGKEVEKTSSINEKIKHSD